jgi:hypothetical protein
MPIVYQPTDADRQKAAAEARHSALEAEVIEKQSLVDGLTAQNNADVAAVHAAEAAKREREEQNVAQMVHGHPHAMARLTWEEEMLRLRQITEKASAGALEYAKNALQRALQEYFKRSSRKDPKDPAAPAVL